jgi:hypothetical protein
MRISFHVRGANESAEIRRTLAAAHQHRHRHTRSKGVLGRFSALVQPKSLEANAASMKRRFDERRRQARARVNEAKRAPSFAFDSCTVALESCMVAPSIAARLRSKAAWWRLR